MSGLFRVSAIALLCALVAGPALAEEGLSEGQKRTIERLKHERDQARAALELLKKRADGDEDEMAQLGRRAMDLFDKVQSRDELQRDAAIRHGLAQGLKALRALKRHPDLEMQIQLVMKKLANEHYLRVLAKQVEPRPKVFFGGMGSKKENLRRKQAEQREREALEQAKSEGVRVLAWRVNILRDAMKVFLEAEKLDAAAMMERAVHTGELMLEGRTDDEAQEIIKATPSLGMLTELLQYSSKLWAKFGNADKAEAAKRLAEFYKARWRSHQKEIKAAQRERRGESEEHEEEIELKLHDEDAREQKGHGHKGHGHEGHDHEREHQIELLARHIEHIQRQMNELTKKLRDLSNETKK